MSVAVTSPCTPQYMLRNCRIQSVRRPTSGPTVILVLVGLGRIELPTSRLSGVRSNHLSYRPFGLMTN